MKLRRCDGSRTLVTVHREFGKDKIEQCPGCPDCFDLREREARIGKYLTVYRNERPPEFKTQIWSVLSEDGDLLGTVEWYGRWRQYVFSPQPNAVFHGECLTDLSSFVTRATKEHREACQRRKSA